MNFRGALKASLPCFLPYARPLVPSHERSLDAPQARIVLIVGDLSVLLVLALGRGAEVVKLRNDHLDLGVRAQAKGEQASVSVQLLSVTLRNER